MNTSSASVAALALVIFSFAQVGCAQDEAAPAPAPEDRQTISGRLETASGNVGTRTVFAAGDAHLHVVAHRLGNKDGYDAARDVDASVGADGSFDLHLTRGARYVFELERGAESVAFFGWRTRDAAAKTTVLAISAATKGKAAVTLGTVRVVGNGAVAEHSLAEAFDASDTTGIDLGASYFLAARGGLITADEALIEASAALEEAEQALEEAAVQLDDAQKQLDDARKQLEEARVTTGK